MSYEEVVAVITATVEITKQFYESKKEFIDRVEFGYNLQTLQKQVYEKFIKEEMNSELNTSKNETATDNI